jgi:16S rRNA (guanine(966)-N(2))-methyltransferase RsmD
LFSILSDVSVERVLDLYAGSGALGIEALSRGAAFAVFVEAGRPALTSLRDNLTRLGLGEQSLVLGLRARAAQAQLQKLGPFQLVLCDPPWKDVNAARDELEQLARAGLFAAGARVVLEHAAKSPPAGIVGSLLHVVDERRWGDTAITLFEPAGVPGIANP